MKEGRDFCTYGNEKVHEDIYIMNHVITFSLEVHQSMMMINIPTELCREGFERVEKFIGDGDDEMF